MDNINLVLACIYACCCLVFFGITTLLIKSVRSNKDLAPFSKIYLIISIILFTIITIVFLIGKLIIIENR